MASIPTWPTLIEGQWNLVASNITSGGLHRLKSQFAFWITYVGASATAPIDAIKEKSPKIFEESNVEKIENQTSIDIYVWIENSDTENDETATNALEVNA